MINHQNACWLSYCRVFKGDQECICNMFGNTTQSTFNKDSRFSITSMFTKSRYSALKRTISTFNFDMENKYLKRITSI